MIKKVKSISEIFEEVKSFDLVITNDAPLNTALNKCLGRSVFGNFAMTSKMIVGKFCENIFDEDILEDIDIVLKIFESKKFSYSIREIWFYLREINSVFRFKSNLERVRTFLSDDAKKIFDFISLLSIKEFGDFSKVIFDFNSKYGNVGTVGTVGVDNFLEFDKRVLLGSESDVPVFYSDENFELDKIYLFDSKKAIVDKVVSMINCDNCNGVAVVLDVSSDYLSILKAKLINLGIPINEGLELSNDFRVREFLSVLELCLNRFNLKVRDVLGVANLFKFDLDQSKMDFDFLKLCGFDSNFSLFNNFLDEVLKGTFGDLVFKFVEVGVELPIEFSDFLYKLNLFDKKIGDEDFLNLKFFVENFSEDVEKTRDGVLLVDCKNSIFINREVIFYVGMDSDWSVSVEKKPYVNFDFEFRRNLDNFSILLQQGVERFIFCTKFTDGEKTIPPFYFNFLFDSNVDSFDSKFFNVSEVNCLSKFCEIDKNFGIKVKNSGDLKFYEKKTLSSSGLNSFVFCSKKFSYSRLNFSCDRDVFLKGNLIHSFAQFYVEFFDFVRGKDIWEFVDIIMGELSFMSNKYEFSVLRNNIKFALMSIMDFVDSLNISSVEFLSGMRVSSKKMDNLFAEKFGMRLKLNNAECEFYDKDLKINGVIDLIVNSVLIVDYKSSGKKKSAKDIFFGANISDLSGFCDFQPLVYFSIFRKLSSEKDLRFLYSFPMINSYNRLVGNELEIETVGVNYFGDEFLDYFFKPEFYDLFYEIVPGYSKKLMEKFSDFSWFSGRIKVLDFEDCVKFVSKFEDDFYLFLVSCGIRDNKTNLANVSKFLRSICDFRKGILRGQKEVYFFKDDVDKFEKFLRQNLNWMNEGFKSSFKYDPIELERSCSVCEFKAVCLKKFNVVKCDENFVEDYEK